jgi:outer membrane protein assembly factor BamA
VAVGVAFVLALGAVPVWAQPARPATQPLDAASGTDADPEPEPSEPPEMTSAPRLRYALEGIEIVGNRRTADRVVLRYVPFVSGDVLDVGDPELELTRYRLLGTGFFSAVRLSLSKGKQRGHAVLVVHVVERNTLVLENVGMGIAADEDTAGHAKPLSPFVGIEGAETNLAGTGMTLGAGLAAAADQWALQARFADPAFAGSNWMVNASLRYYDARDFFGNKQVSFESPLLEQREVTDYAVVDYTRFGGTLGAGHDLASSTQILFDYRLESVHSIVPTMASHVRGDAREPIDFHVVPGASILSALRATLVYDTRDGPFLTTRGTLASVRLDLGLPPLGSSYAFGKVELGVQQWWRLPWNHVIELQAQLGAIAGDAPFFEMYYVGDYTDLLPDRLLGLTPDRRQPPNYLGTDIIEVRYGDYAAKLQGEYRVPLYTGKGSIYGIDAFGAIGLWGVASHRDLTSPPSGYEGAEKAPIDLTYNLGLRIETYVGGFVVAFSNLLGLLPAHGGERK